MFNNKLKRNHANHENATQQLNNPTWPRRRADKLSAAAFRPSKIDGGARELSAARPGPASAAL